MKIIKTSIIFSFHESGFKKIKKIGDHCVFNYLLTRKYHSQKNIK